MFFKKLFGGKKEETNTTTIASPATGKLVALEDVPDPVFSQKMMGEGLAVEPTEGVIVAPVDAEVLQVFPSKHAVGLKTSNGIEILIHIGLETVSMNGEGFEAFVKQGDQVKQGDKLIAFDLDLIREKAKSIITPVILTNGDVIEKLEKTSQADLVKGKTTFFTITPKQ
ncbi:MAG: PTS glucose transporter subunit IIA [Bacillus sp. (in: firmicutes)]